MSKISSKQIMKVSLESQEFLWKYKCKLDPFHRKTSSVLRSFQISRKKKNRLVKSILSFATTWTVLEIFSLSEKNQTQKHNLLVFSIICRVQSVVLTKDILCSYQTRAEVKRDGSMHTNLQLNRKKVIFLNNRGLNALSWVTIGHYNAPYTSTG